MKCRDAHEMMHSYFDNKTDPMKDRHLAEHINSCPKCRAELDFLIKYRIMLKEVKPASPPDNFLAEIHRKIELEQSENPLKRMLDTLKVFLGNYNFHIEAAGVLAVAAIVFFLYRPFYNEKIPEKRAEYTIESSQNVTASRPGKLKESFEQDKSRVSKDMPSVSREITPGAENIKESTAELESRDDYADDAKKSDFDSADIGIMKKSRSAESDKSVMKSEEKDYTDGRINSKVVSGSQEYSKPAPEADIEKAFRELNVNIISRDLSRKDGFYYKVRVSSDKHASILKRLNENYAVEEKIINKSGTYLEIELFLKKKKN